jgi:hypothetical protein
MSTTVIKGTYHAGRVDLDKQVDWPDGCRVRVALEYGMREEDWPDTPENRAEILRRMEAVEPLEFTPEEETEIEAARAAVREVTLAAVRKQMGLEP